MGLPLLRDCYGCEGEPGTCLPGTPFTVSVENANVSCAYAMRSLLTSSAMSPLPGGVLPAPLPVPANVSQARW